MANLANGSTRLFLVRIVMANLANVSRRDSLVKDWNKAFPCEIRLVVVHGIPL